MKSAHPFASLLAATTPAITAGLAVAAAALVMTGWPDVTTSLFVAGAARLAGILGGVPAVSSEADWLLPFAGQPLRVTKACSATDFFLMATAVLAWRLATRASAGRRQRWNIATPAIVALAPLAALAVTLPINAVRLVAVAHAHRWVIPLLPESYGPFLHMLAGATVFLPALIALNLLLEHHHAPSRRTPARPHPSRCPAA